MRGVLFIVGCALVALTLGMPEGLPKHSGSAKSAIPAAIHWVLSEALGEVFVVGIGVALIVASFLKKGRTRPKGEDED